MRYAHKMRTTTCVSAGNGYTSSRCPRPAGFRYDHDLHGRNFRYLNVTPSCKALRAERQKLRERINKQASHEPIPRLIRQVNEHLLGWSRYFSYGYPRKAMREINHYVRNRIIRHLRRRSQRPFRPPTGQSYYRHLKQLGLVYL
jgi:RNA-directed DNA polymerase